MPKTMIEPPSHEFAEFFEGNRKHGNMLLRTKADSFFYSFEVVHYFETISYELTFKTLLTFHEILVGW